MAYSPVPFIPFFLTMMSHSHWPSCSSPNMQTLTFSPLHMLSPHQECSQRIQLKYSFPRCWRAEEKYKGGNAKQLVFWRSNWGKWIWFVWVKSEHTLKDSIWPGLADKPGLMGCLEAWVWNWWPPNVLRRTACPCLPVIRWQIKEVPDPLFSWTSLHNNKENERQNTSSISDRRRERL